MNTSTKPFRIAALAADGFQEIELAGPLQAFQNAGAQVDLISDHPGEVQGLDTFAPVRKHPVTETINNVRAQDYDAVFTPGGVHSPAILAGDGRFLDFIRAMDAAWKPVTSICRGGYVLAASGVVKGHRATGANMGGDFRHLDVKPFMEKAGATWQEDSPAVVDGNLVTSRGPDDIPEFSAAALKVFGLT